MEKSIPTMLTCRETAKAAKVAEHYVRQLVKDNRIVHVRCGNRCLINFEKFVEFLNTGDQEAQPEPEYGKVRKLG